MMRSLVSLAAAVLAGVVTAAAQQPATDEASSKLLAFPSASDQAVSYGSMGSFLLPGIPPITQQSSPRSGVTSSELSLGSPNDRLPAAEVASPDVERPQDTSPGAVLRGIPPTQP